MVKIRQRRVLKKLIENDGKSVSRAMIEAGYSEQTAKNPQRLTKSKTWRELVEEYLPNDKLLRKVDELVDAKRKIRRIEKGEVVFEAEEIDTYANKAGLEFAFRIRNSYAGKKEEFEDPYEKMTDAQLDAEIAKLEATENRYKSAKSRKAKK